MDFVKIIELLCSAASTTGKAVSDHMSKHGNKYIAGAAVGVTGVAAYAVGEAQGHKDGKVEGTAEQAERDEKKMQAMHQEHERDRAEWKKIDQEKDDLIDDILKEQK